MDWSSDLLGPQERLLLRRLSVFAGHWTLAAAEQIVISESLCGEAIKEWEVLDLLTSLLDKSLVIAETQADVSRYYLLQTTRQYAREKLVADGEESRVRQQHCDIYTALAAEAAAKLEGPEQHSALDTLEREHDNLREAITWCHERPEAAEAELRLVRLLAPYWMMRGHRTEGRERTAAFLEQDDVDPTQARAKLLYFAGAFAYLQGDPAAAVVSYDRALTIQIALNDHAGEAVTLSGRGIVATQQGDFAQARACFERARTLHQEFGNVPAEAAVLNNMGLLLLDEGDLTQARVCFEDALTHFRTLGNRARETAILINLGVLAADQRDYPAAHHYYEQALTAAREMGASPDEATTLYNLGYVSRHEGDVAAARAYAAQSLALSRELGDRKLEALCLQETIAYALAE
jgi:Tfp pilus assembly protein PilF